MKKMLSVLLAAMMIATLALTGCGQNNDPQPDPQPSGLTGSVATDGSTSMQKVINTLGEAFMNENKGITFTYNPTGSGSGIKAVQEGRCDIGLSSRALKEEEKAQGLTDFNDLHKARGLEAVRHQVGKEHARDQGKELRR